MEAEMPSNLSCSSHGPLLVVMWSAELRLWVCVQGFHIGRTTEVCVVCNAYKWAHDLIETQAVFDDN